MRPSQLGGHPHERRCRKRACTECGNAAPHHDGKQGRKEGKVGDERRVENDGDPRRKTAVQGHDPSYPIQRPGKIDHARRQAEQEGPARRHTAACERDEERRERKPAECRMAEFRKTERQESAGRER
jgi:hypothetical protein